MEEFQAMAREHPQMSDFFDALFVDLEDAHLVFSLLDLDGGGKLAPAELVNGCTRLRGPARSLDLCLLMKHADTITLKLEEITKTLAENSVHDAPIVLRTLASS